MNRSSMINHFTRQYSAVLNCLGILVLLLGYFENIHAQHTFFTRVIDPSVDGGKYVLPLLNNTRIQEEVSEVHSFQVAGASFTEHAKDSIPPAPDYILTWVYQGEILQKDTIRVCLGDSLGKFFMNLSDSTDMILRQVAKGAYYEIPIAAKDSLIAITLPATHRMEGSFTFVSFPDANKNGKLDDMEASFPGDTLVYTVIVSDNIVFTKQARDVSTCEGGVVKLSVDVEEATGGNWQYWDNHKWVNVEETNTEMILSNVSREWDGYRMRYFAYNYCGDTAYSDVATISVDTTCSIAIESPCSCMFETSPGLSQKGRYAERIKIKAPAGLTMLIGEGSKGFYKASTQGDPEAYYPGDTIPESSPGSYLLDIMVIEGSQYSFYVSIDSSKNIMEALTITKSCGASSQILLHPKDTSVCPGEDASFTIKVQGADSISCQVKWNSENEFVEVSGQGKLNGGEITEEYTTVNTQSIHDSLMYRVLAFSCGTAISDTGLLDVSNIYTGTLFSEFVSCLDSSMMLSAVHQDEPIVPEGHSIWYLLAQGEDSHIIKVSNSPTFRIAFPGTYSIHTFIAENRDLPGQHILDFLPSLEQSEMPLSEFSGIVQSLEICTGLDSIGVIFHVDKCIPSAVCNQTTYVAELSNWDERSKRVNPLDPILYFRESLIDDGEQEDSTLHQFILNGAGQLMVKNDTAIIMGIAASKADTSAKLDMRLVLISPHNYKDRSTEEGIWLAQRMEAHTIAIDEYDRWTHWVVDTTSRLSGLGSLTGTYLKVSNSPSSLTNSIQKGMGVNEEESDNALSGKFLYEGKVSYQSSIGHIQAQGTLHADIVNNDTICSQPIVGPMLYDFSAQPISKNTIQVRYGTLIEGNGGYIVVERSVDGQIFEQIQIAEGQTTHFYHQLHIFTDYDEHGSGHFFYRLKIVKPDGTFAYTDVVEVYLETIEDNQYHVYPNPIGHQTLNVLVKEPQAGAYFYELYQMDGKRVERDTLNTSGSKLNVSHLSSGVYVLKIISPDGDSAIKRITVK